MHTAESLLELSKIQAGYGGFKCIHELFEERVKCNPESVAVVFAGEQLTYQDLNIRANKLAHHLREINVKVDNFYNGSISKSQKGLEISVIAVVHI